MFRIGRRGVRVKNRPGVAFFAMKGGGGDDESELETAMPVKFWRHKWMTTTVTIVLESLALMLERYGTDATKEGGASTGSNQGRTRTSNK